MHTPLSNTAVNGTAINVKYNGASQSLSTFWSTTVPNVSTLGSLVSPSKS